MAIGSIIKDVAKTAKNKAVKAVSGAVFGKGLVGGALGKSFEKKFGEQEQENTDVADALKEQESAQDNNNATLTRIETIVMNIADNIYNIAGVLNAQVVSMKEAQRLQQARAFGSAAASEEATSEALKVGTPSPAATSEKTATDKKGGISDLIDSVLGTKKIFKGFLKKFAVFAAGITAVGLAGFAASTLMSGKDAEGNPEASDVSGTPPAGPNEPQAISSTPPGAPGGAPSSETPAATGPQTTAPESAPSPASPVAAVPGKPAPTPTSVPGPSISAPSPGAAPNAPAQAPEQSKNVLQSNKAMVGGAASEMLGVSLPELIRKTPTATAPQPTPAAPPPSVAATEPTKVLEGVELKEYFDRPENASEKAQLDQTLNSQTVIERAILSTKKFIQSAKTPEEKAQHETILKDQLEPGLKAVKTQQKTIVDRAHKAIQLNAPYTSALQTSGGGEAAAISPGSGGGAPSAAAAAGGGGAPGASPAGGGGEGGGGGGAPPGASPAGGGGGGGAPPGASPAGGGGASAVPPSPSSGASIGTASTAVAAASENTPPKVSSTQINNDTTSGDKPAPTSIPSPIAVRGSLDQGTIFGSGS
jgi:hypothetical protein